MYFMKLSHKAIQKYWWFSYCNIQRIRAYCIVCTAERSSPPGGHKMGLYPCKVNTIEILNSNLKGAVCLRGNLWLILNFGSVYLRSNISVQQQSLKYSFTLISIDIWLCWEVFWAVCMSIYFNKDPLTLYIASQDSLSKWWAHTEQRNADSFKDSLSSQYVTNSVSRLAPNLSASWRQDTWVIYSLIYSHRA